MKSIRFEKASFKHKQALFKWLEEPFVREFWDNSPAHKEDIQNFMNGRKVPSDYFKGQFVYWLGFIDDQPYSLIMTIKEVFDEELPQIIKQHLSKTGSTYALDYMIGNKEFFGRGLGAKTLEDFIAFFQREVDSTADTFFIDPDVNNSRAKHVYEKAGFEYVGDFLVEGESVFKGSSSHFLVKKLKR